MAMQASFAESTIMPWIRSSRLMRLWIAANMVDPCDGAPPLRQAFSLTVNSSVSFRQPFSKSTPLLSGSSKSALGTLVWKVSSFLTVMFEAACAKAIAAAKMAAPRYALANTSRIVRKSASAQTPTLSDWHAALECAIASEKRRSCTAMRIRMRRAVGLVEPAAVEHLLGAAGRARRRHEGGAPHRDCFRHRIIRRHAGQARPAFNRRQGR